MFKNPYLSQITANVAIPLTFLHQKENAIFAKFMTIGVQAVNLKLLIKKDR